MKTLNVLLKNFKRFQNQLKRLNQLYHNSLVDILINQLKTSSLKTTHRAVVVISKIKTIEAGRAAYKTALFTFEIFKK